MPQSRSAVLSLTRRELLARTGGGLAALALSPRLLAADPGDTGERLIADVTREVIFPGRRTGMTWFHPRPCRLPGHGGETAVLMTLQSIGGSDVFGPVHWTLTRDGGRTWSDPEPIPGLGRRSLGDGWEVGVCDIVPEYHPPTKTVLALGHNVYYKDGVLARPQRQRWPVYTARSAGGDQGNGRDHGNGKWSQPRRLEWDDPRATAIYTNNCGQRVTLPGGDVLMMLSFGPRGRTHRSAAAGRCSFDGRTLAIKDVGNELTNSTRRGFLEPSLVSFDSRFYLTLRAEDGRGYVAVSDDGLHWEQPRPWCWDDGEPLVMSTTQQHWLPHSEGLFLVYTRKAEENRNVFRWRAPLYVAAVDTKTLRLVRASERVVLPLIGDGVNDPEHVARMGNFHTVAVTADESWVTVGETLPADGWRGDTLLARIRWSRPNALVPLNETGIRK